MPSSASQGAGRREGLQCTHVPLLGGAALEKGVQAQTTMATGMCLQEPTTRFRKQKGFSMNQGSSRQRAGPGAPDSS